MNNLDIMFVDLLYKAKGSFDDDFCTIKKSIVGKSLLHLRVSPSNPLLGLLTLISAIVKEQPKALVFLSYKLWQLILLIPLTLLLPTYAVYHFRPNARSRFHDLILPFVCRFYSFAAYGDAVRKYLCTVTGLDIPLVASRLIDKKKSFNRMVYKLNQGSSDIFCPGIREGVRIPLEYQKLKRQVECVLGHPISNIYVQDSTSDANPIDDKVNFVPSMLPDSMYSRFYCESLFVAMIFHPDYEARSSAMINDALTNGCIVLTDAHPITLQYGYPYGFVTDVEHLPFLLASIHNGKIGSDDITGFDYEGAKESWSSFLKLGV